MAKMKIFEIARSLQSKDKDIRSGDLVKLLNENGFDVKGANSNIEDAAIAFLLKSFQGGGAKTAKPETKKVDAPASETKPEVKEEIIIESKPEKKAEEKPVVKKEVATPSNAKASPSNAKAEEKKPEPAPVKTENTEADKSNKPQLERNHTQNNSQGGQQYNNNNQHSSQNNYNRNDNQGGQSNYNRNNNQGGQSNYNRNNNQGGQSNYNRNNNNQGGQSNYNRNNNQGGQSNYNRNNNQGGQSNYNRNDNQGGQSSYNRNNNQGGQSNYNRNNNNQGGQSNYNRNNNQGGQSNYNRNSNQGGQSGYNQGGQSNYNRSNNQGGQSNYNRNNNQGGGQSGYNRNNNQGGQSGYNRGNNQGGQSNYNRSNNQGGQSNYNRGNNQGGQSNYNRGNNQGGGYNNRGGSNQGNGVYERFEKSQNSFDAVKPETKLSRTKNRKVNQGSPDARGKYKKSSMVEMNRIRSKKDPNRKGAFIRPEPIVAEVKEEIKQIIISESLTIKDLADKMKMPASTLIKKLFLQGKMVSVNQDITFEEAEEIALEFDIIAELEEKVDVVAELLKEDDEDEGDMVKRPPVVCVMGHVDHGKTSLLDAIRESNVSSREAGGITQHIGAYVVRAKGEKITFLDTPGHEAFTSMRMRGAQSTDIAILVVAADDGVMPQTVEAINHAKAAEIEIIVAINKIDKVGANLERVKQELAEYELIPEDWGGNTIFVPVSAHTKEGIDHLLEMIVLTADVLELKANKNRKARGIVIEAQLDKGRGPVATVLVQKGVLRIGDNVVIGSATGKVRAMIDHKGERVKKAGPSTPVEILGLNGVPNAGETFLATETDKEAKNIAAAYIGQGKEKLLEETKAKKLSLDGLFSQIQAGNIKDLNLIIKADVQGSVQAIKQSLLKLSNEEVAIRVIHGGVGAINESDVSLAIASSAIIIGFNVRADNMAKEVADREEVDLRLYRVIYDAIADIESAMKGMLEPIYEEKVIAHAEIRATFKASGIGTIAGSYVLDGKIVRGCSVRVTRAGELIFEGALASLKRMKDDVKEVAKGFECGMVFENFNEIQEEDLVECYIMEEVPR